MIIGFIIIVTVIGIWALKIEEDDNTALSIALSIMAIIGLSFIMAFISDYPTALDVYKGKTELQITYKGTIPIDSVVVFKNK